MKLPFQSDKAATSPDRAPKTSTRKTPERRRRSASLRRLVMTLVMVTLPLLAIPPFVVYWQALGELGKAAHEQAGLSAQMLAGGIQHWVERQIATAELVAKDVEIARLLRSRDMDALEQKSRSLGYLFPESIRVRLLLPGLAREDLDATPPITFAVVDMVRAAETSDRQPPMEVHASGTPQQHINLVRRVLDPSGRRIVGHLLVSFPVQDLQRMIGDASLSGYAELRQSSSLVLASQGDASIKAGPSDGQASVRGSRWQVSYWVADARMADGRKLLMAGWVAAGLAALVLFPVAMLLYKKMLAALRLDQAACLGIVKDLRERRSKPVHPVAALAEMSDTLELMSREADKGCAVTQAKTKTKVTATKEAAPESIEEVQADMLFDSSALASSSAAGQGSADVSASIFRAYDIRGVVDNTLTTEVVYQLGRAIGSEAYFRGEQTVVVGRDGRLSGPELMDALVQGLKSTGRDVIDIGLVPTPVLYFAAQHLGTGSGVMVTGSHNPPDYNGLKIMLAGEALASEAIQELRKRVETGDLLTGEGSVEKVNVLDDYVARVKSDVQVIRPLKVVVDCGNGAAGEVAPRALKELGCQVEALFCDIDGTFPNHHPDPGKPENLTALIQAVQDQGADLGIAFDGDGDRLGVVTSQGAIIWPDRLMMLYSADVLSRNPGAQIIYDVKSSRNLGKAIAEHGGEALMWQTGHSLLKAKMKETGALLAGEFSGHVFFKERWFGFDDGVYAAARLLEIIANDGRAADEIFAELPDSVNTPELTIGMAEGEPAAFIEKLRATAHFEGAQVINIDGVRVEFDNGWGLVRASNTTPSLGIRFEADDEMALYNIQEEFRRALLQVDPGLSLPF